MGILQFFGYRSEGERKANEAMDRFSDYYSGRTLNEDGEYGLDDDEVEEAFVLLGEAIAAHNQQADEYEEKGFFSRLLGL